MPLPRIAIQLTLLAMSLALPGWASDEPASAGQVRVLLDKGDPAQAREVAPRQLEALEARGEGESQEASQLLDLLLVAAQKKPEGSDATLRLSDRAVALKERLHGPDAPALADTLCASGLALRWAGNYDPARPLYDRCIAIREKALPPDDPALSDALLEAANLIQRQGKFAEALPLYERALTMRERRLGPSHPDVANVLHNMGNLRLRMGDYVPARGHYQRALEIRRAALGPRHIDVALTLVTLGVLLQNMGDYAEAREGLEEAIGICRERQGPDSLLLSGALNNLGNVHWSFGEAAKARDAYRQALDIKLRVFGPDHPDLAQELNNLAEAHISLKEYDAALPLLERATLVVEKQLGPDHFTLATPLGNLGNLMARMGRLDEARRIHQRSLSIRVAHVDRSHPEVAQSIMNLSGVALAEGNRSEALGLAVEANALILKQIRDTLAYLPESAALQLASSKIQPETVLFEGLRTAKDDAADWLQACWTWTLQRRGIVLEEMAARHRTVLQGEGPEARAASQQLARARAELGALWAGGSGAAPPERYRVQIKEAIDRKESAEESLAALSVRFRGERDRRRADLAAVRSALRPHEALVEYARVEIGLPVLDPKPVHDIALILRPDGITAWEDLGLADSTDRLVAAWRAQLSASFEQRDDAAAASAAHDRLDKAGSDLRQAVWDPIARHLKGVRLVLIVADGSIHQVDLGALPGSEGKFLIETAPPMQLVSAGRDLLARSVGFPDGASATPRGLLALGAPDFGAGPAGATAHAESTTRRPNDARHCAAPRDTTWLALPESAREVTAVAEILKGRGPVTKLTGARATEAELRREAPGRRTLHLATHGYFLEPCGDAAENPLLYSGLVLAGANTAKPAAGASAADDGILTAEEIVAMDLRGVELSVLSACDTGRGEVKVGEGVFGLRRALEIAGVRTVVMSLWPVPDRQARRWMTAFYRAHIDGSAARDAARQASLSLLSDLRDRNARPHPYMWTGFVVAGGVD